MGVNSGDVQASVRSATGTSLTYEGDWHALFTAVGIPSGDFNGRMLQWINQNLGTSYVNLPGALTAFSVAMGGSTINDLGTIAIPTVGTGFAFYNNVAGWLANKALTQLLLVYTNPYSGLVQPVTRSLT